MIIDKDIINIIIQFTRLKCYGMKNLYLYNIKKVENGKHFFLKYFG